jgi:uncharacterized membrane protein YidH (DUF202 family)
MDRHPTIDDLLNRDPSPDVVLIPAVNTSDPDLASVEYSQHRTKLSTHRTALSTRRTEMSSRRTGMSFQRSRLSAERTALSLISFGFTIYQFLGRLVDEKLVSGAPHAARNFGQALVWLGVGMLVVGIIYHIQFMLGLRKVRAGMRDETLIHAESVFPVSFTLVVAVLLLGIGLVALASLTFQVGPFH